MLLQGPALAAHCGQLIDDISTVEGLHELLADMHARYAFFDLDETIIIPDTPFIYGMPGPDVFLEALSPCEKSAMSWLGSRMEAAYYAAPLKLVSKLLPSVIRDLQVQGWHVYALTSRGTGNVPYDWHARLVVDFLAAADVKFSPLQRHVAHLGNETVAGGMLFVGGELNNKADLIVQVVPTGASAVLIDNTRRKLEQALLSTDPSAACLIGVHFVGAKRHEQDDASRREWLCMQLAQASVPCEGCQAFARVAAREL